MLLTHLPHVLLIFSAPHLDRPLYDTRAGFCGYLIGSPSRDFSHFLTSISFENKYNPCLLAGFLERHLNHKFDLHDQKNPWARNFWIEGFPEIDWNRTLEINLDSNSCNFNVIPWIDIKHCDYFILKCGSSNLFKKLISYFCLMSNDYCFKSLKQLSLNR